MYFELQSIYSRTYEIQHAYRRNILTDIIIIIIIVIRRNVLVSSVFNGAMLSCFFFFSRTLLRRTQQSDPQGGIGVLVRLHRRWRVRSIRRRMEPVTRIRNRYGRV